MNGHRHTRWLTLLALLGVLLSALALPSRTPAALAAGNPTSVTIAGSLQEELGCTGDWQANCAATHLAYDASDDVWQGAFNVPAGGYEYKAALNDNWDESYGLNGGGDNIPLNLAAGSSVKFYYDHKSHWITDNKRSVIAVAPGNFQRALGCSGDWQADCLRSWLQDVDGDGIYTFETTALPAGSYEGKVAINEGWDENYGQGGAPGGANIAFTVAANNAKVSFSYNAATHVLTILAGHAHDNNVEWDGLRHDSRDTLYRAPGGAVPAGTPVKIRFRTYHDDVTGVKLRVYDLNAGGQSVVPMAVAASGVSCYQPGLESETCDFWEATLPNAAPNNLWYRFIVSDGSKTAYYADNTSALDGGLGAPTNDPIDQSWALMVYKPGFKAPDWASKAVIYQIFPDRFRNGRDDNNAKTGDVRYDDPVLKLPWGTLPEGYCRNYAAATTASCPWRFGAPPNTPATQLETPRGRDYMGGDLKGVDQQLDYLKSLGINTLYFNPIFDAGSNHSYDTQDYYKIDPYFGTQKDWENLNKHADQLGIKIVLDGVFNHMSSDSPFFDRYQHYATVGACESVSSQYRPWFTFHDVAAGTGTCAGSAGPKSATYDGWFGFDSIPVLTKSNADLQKYFLTAADSVSKHWLKAGAEGWRLDVMGDSSFPNGYWETFRNVVKSQNKDALIIGELWQKDSTLLRFLRGDRADATMNYRLRDAVIGLLTPGSFDSKGFADSGRIISPSEFAARLSSIREDYSDASYYSLMNLLDSHDTERLLWTLTAGPETTANKEQNAANLAAGKQRQRLASLIQFTVPGSPTVYYGDEVGVTGDDDPDDRRTYPWADLGGNPDMALFSHYQKLASLRSQNAALTAGDFRVLLADDSSQVVAYGRKTTSQAAVVIVNRGDSAQTGPIPVGGYLPNGVTLKAAYVVGAGGPSTITVTNGQINGSIGANSALVLLTGNTDLQPPAAPTGLHATEGNAQVGLTWSAVSGAAGYNVYRSPVSGGGWVKINGSLVTGTSFTDTGLENARSYYYAVTALDSAGNESKPSAEVKALPHLTIGWANLQWPPTLTHTISATNRTDTVYGQAWIDGVTSQAGATKSLVAQLGFGPSNSNPAGNAQWSWVDASFNGDSGNNDEFKASLLPDQTGSYDYAYRYSTTGGRDWVYADLDGIGNGYSPAQAGKLTVVASGDTSAPAVPGNLHVIAASPAGIELAWDAVGGDASLYGYEVRRSNTSGGPYTTIATVTGGAAGYVDTSVTESATYYYVVRSVDTSFNRSGSSAQVTATAQLRTVTLVFNVTVPSTTDATGRSVYIAGFLDRLDGGLPQWNPGGVVLTRVDATHWTITFTGKETTQIEYKYAQGSWDFVEKDASCAEISNRQLTLSYGSSGTQTVNDTIENWRNVSPCGN
ncbi:MAG: alpha-amylase [Kouleothrix sp.]|nr:alpha-amylase [Kouleothrix sp.]